jgi:predicted ester cyclase
MEANRGLGRRFFAEQDRLQGGPAPELCTIGYRAHLGGNPPLDRAGHEAFASAFYQAFEGMHHEVEDVVADSDSVVVRFAIRGKHTAPFFGIPPTERNVEVRANVILRVEGDQVKELFGIFDEAGMLRQLGVLPS